MSASAWIDVDREEGWRDKARAYKVMIDGQEAGTIRHGEQQTFEVVPGAHEVFLKIDWCRSPKLAVDVAGGGRAKVTLRAGRQHLDGGVRHRLQADVLHPRRARFLRRIAARSGRITIKTAETRWYPAHARGCSSVW